MVQLTSEQEKNIISHLVKYKKPFEEELKGWEKERREKSKFFKSIFGKESIENLNEENFRKALKDLWSFRGWTNKDYRVDNIIRNNGFSKIKEELKKLLHDDKPITDRIDKFELKGIGPSSFTEILLFVFPEKYCLWNKRAREVFQYLKFDQLNKNLYKYSYLEGEDYISILDVMNQIKNLLGKNGYPDLDFLDADIFIWTISEEADMDTRQVMPIKREEILQEGRREKKLTAEQESKLDKEYEDKILDLDELEATSTHERICEMLDFIGTQSGFDVSQKHKLIEDHPYLMDVAWLKGRTPHIAIEVQMSGNPTEAIDRLTQAKKFNFRKVVLVAKYDWRDRLNSLLKYHDLNNWIDIWSIKSIYELYQSAKKFYDLYTQLEESKYKKFEKVEFI